MVNGTRTNCRLPHQKICRRTNTLPAEKYHWGNQEPSFKRDAVLLYPRGEKKTAMEQIKENTRPSVLQKLQQRQEEIAQREQTRTKPKKRSHGMEL